MGGTWTIPHLSVDKMVLRLCLTCAWPFREFRASIFHAVIFVWCLNFFHHSLFETFSIWRLMKAFIFECWLHSCDGGDVDVCVWFHYHAPGSFMFGSRCFEFCFVAWCICGWALVVFPPPTWQLVQYLFQYMISIRKRPYSAFSARADLSWSLVGRNPSWFFLDMDWLDFFLPLNALFAPHILDTVMWFL